MRHCSGHLVTTILATDNDDVNERVTYRWQKLRHNDVIPFHLDPDSGQVTVSGKLWLELADREYKQYTPEVVAEDLGTPRSSSHPQRLHIIVNRSLPLSPNDVGHHLSAQNVSSRDRPRGSSVIVAVTVSIGSVLLIVAILFVVLLRRRRRRRTCSKYTPAVTSSASCSNASPTSLKTPSSAAELHCVTIPRSYAGRGQRRRSDDVICPSGQGQGDESKTATPGVDFLFNDCRPLQVSVHPTALLSIANRTAQLQRACA